MLLHLDYPTSMLLIVLYKTVHAKWDSWDGYCCNISNKVCLIFTLHICYYKKRDHTPPAVRSEILSNLVYICKLCMMPRSPIARNTGYVSSLRIWVGDSPCVDI